MRDVASANSQAEEIDALLKWQALLSVDHRTGDNISHDIKTRQTFVYSFKPKQTSDKAYAGTLDDNGDSVDFNTSVYGQTFTDLYMHVLQLCAYAFYNIAPIPQRQKLVTPCSACDLAESYRLAGEETETEDE